MTTCHPALNQVDWLSNVIELLSVFINNKLFINLLILIFYLFIMKERDRAALLEIKLHGHESDRHTLSNLEEMVTDLRRERDALREAARESAFKQVQ